MRRIVQKYNGSYDHREPECTKRGQDRIAAAQILKYSKYKNYP